MNAAIYYHPEGYTTGGSRLMGRQAAGESFLRGFFSYSTAASFWALVEEAKFGQMFAEAAKKAHRTAPVHILTRNRYDQLSIPGTLYMPGPGLGDMAWPRSFFGHEAYSLCGITHTTASIRSMDAIADLLTAPVQPWDALICTSTAVRDNVLQILDNQHQYLQQRLGATRLVLPQLPLIPLGVHCADFTFSPAQRAAAQQALGLEDGTIVVLFLGRLAFHAKAHPLAMYQALAQASESLPPGQKVVVIECGWHANDFMAQAYPEAASMACPNIQVMFLDGRKADNRAIAWAAADIFCSLSDNIQETFGITPIEAMAAGLPVVVTDWDGYRDTVRDGIDGFRVPTLMPAANMGRDLAIRHALGIDSYDCYCGNTCMLVAVDVDAVTLAFSRLFSSTELRRKMGAAGRQRARELFDWARIIPRYEQLWQQLQELRSEHGPSSKDRNRHWPARMDPFTAFAGYATTVLTPHILLARVDKTLEESLSRLSGYRNLAMVNFADGIVPTTGEVETLLAALADRPLPAGQIIAAVGAENRRAIAYRGLIWLVKLHILRILPAAGKPLSQADD